MKPLTDKEKAAIQALTDAYAASVKTHPTKKKHDFKGSETTESNFANFSANPAVEDIGNESGIYDDCADFASFNRKAREETAFQAIKRIVAVSNVRESAKRWATQSNEIRRRNKAKKAEQDAQKKDKFVSHPGWF